MSTRQWHRAAAAQSSTYPEGVIDLRLTHPAIDFWIDVRLRQFEGSWLAVADLASTPEPARWPRDPTSLSSWHCGRSARLWRVAWHRERTCLPDGPRSSQSGGDSQHRLRIPDNPR